MSVEGLGRPVVDGSECLGSWLWLQAAGCGSKLLTVAPRGLLTGTKFNRTPARKRLVTRLGESLAYRSSCRFCFFGPEQNLRDTDLDLKS